MRVQYRALDKNSKIQEGIVSSEQLLSSTLKQKELILISVRRMPKNAQKIPIKVLQMFWLSLDHFTRTGVSITDAVQLFLNVVDNHKSVFKHIHDRLIHGEVLSNIMVPFLDEHDSVTLSLLRASEQTGAFVFKELEEWVSWRLEKQTSLKNALRYPIILLCIVWASVCTMISMLVPHLTSAKELFWGTELLIQIHKVLKVAPVMVYLAPIGILFGMFCLYKLVRYFIKDRYFFISKIGIFFAEYEYVPLTKTLSLLLKNGYRLQDALLTIQDGPLHTVIKNIGNELKNGTPLRMALSHYPTIFSNYFLQTIAIGESSNSLPTMFEILHKYYQEKIIRRAKSVIALVEPTSILIVGGVFAFVIASIFYPLYEQTIQAL